MAGMRIDPGLWLLSSEVIDVAAPDLPLEVRNRMVGPRSRLRHCITPEQAASPSANFLAAQVDGRCRYRSFSVSDGRIEGAMTCPEAEANMVGRFQRDSYVMRMDMVSPMPGGTNMTIKVRAVGRRIGECEGGS